jgi:hypothetical protein
LILGGSAGMVLNLPCFFLFQIGSGRLAPFPRRSDNFLPQASFGFIVEGAAENGLG